MDELALPGANCAPEVHEDGMPHQRRETARLLAQAKVLDVLRAMYEDMVSRNIALLDCLGCASNIVCGFCAHLMENLAPEISQVAAAISLT